MKRLAVMLGLLSLAAGPKAPAPSAKTVIVQFDFDFENHPELGQFFVYYGKSSFQYTTKLTAGTATNLTVGGLSRNTLYYFNVTCADTNGIEYGYTTEVSVRTPH